MRLSAQYLFDDLLPQLERLGCDREALLTEAEFPARTLDETQGLFLDVRRVLRAATQALGDPLALARVGWHEGLPEAPLSLAMTSGETVHDLLRRFVEFGDTMVGEVAVAIEPEAERTRVAFHFAERDVDPTSVEWLVLSIASLVLRATARRASIGAVHLPHAPHPERSAYRDALDVAIRFESGSCGFELAGGDLELELNERSPVVVATMSRLLKEQQRSRAAEHDRRLIAKSRVALLARLSLGHDSSVSAIADEFSMSGRSYQRRLRAHGRSFRSLKREAVVEFSQRLLSDTEHPIETISERCGFAHKSAFHRAFKRATGQTPEAYRVAPRTARRGPDHAPPRRRSELPDRPPRPLDEATDLPTHSTSVAFREFED